MNRRGENNVYIVKRGAEVIYTFDTMKAVAFKLDCSIANVEKAIEQHAYINGMSVSAKNNPLFVRQYNLDGRLLRKFETIAEASYYMAFKKGDGTPAAYASGIAAAIRSKTNFRFGYKWRRDGIEYNEALRNTVRVKKECSFWLYNEVTDSYRQCKRRFGSQGAFNRYCPTCQARIDDSTNKSMERTSKLRLSLGHFNKNLD